jgi:hypothetical protein
VCVHGYLQFAILNREGASFKLLDSQLRQLCVSVHILIADIKQKIPAIKIPTIFSALQIETEIAASTNRKS